MATSNPLIYKDAKSEKWRFRGQGTGALQKTLREALRRSGDFEMNGSVLVKIQGGRVEIFLNCTHEEEEILAPIMSEIRRVAEEGLVLVGVEGLLVGAE